MSERPLITVGIPCHNAASWLGIAIDSALHDQELPVEVIVVDDHSTDDSAHIATSRAVRFFSSDSHGAPAARNRILAEARGRLIQYLDADDYLLPGKMARQLEEASSFAPGTVPYAPVIAEVWRGGESLSRHTPHIDTSLPVEVQWILWQLPQTSGPLWPVDILRGLGGWKADQPCCQEHELYLRAMQAGVKFGFTPSALAVYRLWSEETLCRRDPSLVVRERSRLIDGMLDWLQAEGRLQPEHTAAAGRAFFEMSRTLAQHNLDEAVRYHAAHRGRGLISAVGPAAPQTYRLFYRLCGFAAAERIARCMRR